MIDKHIQKCWLPNEVYDDVVIGSSPLMLLQAGMLAREGRKVCLLERERFLGGSWQVAQLDNGESVEIACHLIEFFPGIYEFLEGASGVRFEPLDAQPIRVHRTRIIFPYFSRVLMIATGARLFFGLLASKFNVIFSRKKNFDLLINFQKKFSSYIRYQCPAFFQRPVMQGPKHGFVYFLNMLIKRCEDDGVLFKHFDVAAMERDQNGYWGVSSSKGEYVLSEHVHCTTSTNLRCVTLGRFVGGDQEFKHRTCVVMEVASMDLNISQTYVAFWSDPLVARISRIDLPEEQSYERYLVEFHDHDFTSRDNWQNEVRERMESAKIINKGGAYKYVGKVDCMFTKNMDQLPSGRIDENFWGYYSMGNLAAGLAAWRKSDRVPLLTKKNKRHVHNEVQDVS